MSSVGYGNHQADEPNRKRIHLRKLFTKRAKAFGEIVC